MSDGLKPGDGRIGRKTAEAIACIAVVLFDMGRHSGFDEGTIRRHVARAFGDALEEKADFYSVMGPEGAGPAFMVSPAGLFRPVFDEWASGREDRFMQESWLVIAERDVERAMAATRRRGPGVLESRIPRVSPRAFRGIHL